MQHVRRVLSSCDSFGNEKCEEETFESVYVIAVLQHICLAMSAFTHQLHYHVSFSP